MGYDRKGGKGKSGTLRQQFNYYKQQLERRLVEEQAFIEARGGFSFSGKPSTLFKVLDYTEVFEKGITRKVNNVTVRFTGEEAVKIQIESLKNRSSKSKQSDQFITNYCGTLNKEGYDPFDIEKVRKKLQSISTDKLAILIDKNILPQIYYLYDAELNKEDVLQDIYDAIDKGVTNKEVREVRERKKLLEPLIKEKFRILK